MSYTPGAMAVELFMRAREKEAARTSVWTQEDLEPVMTSSATDGVATLIILARLLVVVVDRLADATDVDSDTLASKIALLVAQAEMENPES